MYCLIIFCTLYAVLFSCSSIGEPEEDYLVLLKTDSESYVADPSTIIYLYVTNEGKSPVYYFCVRGMTLNEYENLSFNKSWTLYERAQCYKVDSIESKSTQIFELDFLKWEHLPDAKFDQTVDYKLKILLYKDPKGESTLNFEKQFSDYFKIIRK